MPSAYLQWQFHSGERVVARGPLVLFADQSAVFRHNRFCVECGKEEKCLKTKGQYKTPSIVSIHAISCGLESVR